MAGNGDSSAGGPPRDFEKECRALVKIVAKKIWAARNGAVVVAAEGGTNDKRDPDDADTGDGGSGGGGGNRWRSPSVDSALAASATAVACTPPLTPAKSRKFVANSGPPPWASQLRKTPKVAKAAASLSSTPDNDGGGGTSGGASSAAAAGSSSTSSGRLPPQSPSQRASPPVPPSPSSLSRRSGGTPSSKGGFSGGGGGGASDLVEIGIQLGKTKVFLRQRAFDTLERLRNDARSSAATKLNARFRTYLCRLAYVPVRDAFREERARKDRMVREAKERLNQANTASNLSSGDNEAGGGGGRFRSGGARASSSSWIRSRSGGGGGDRDGSSGGAAANGDDGRAPSSEAPPLPPQEPRKVYIFKWLLVDGRWVRNYAAEEQEAALVEAKKKEEGEKEEQAPAAVKPGTRGRRWRS